MSSEALNSIARSLRKMSDTEASILNVTSINDTNNNEVIKVGASTGAVNEITVSNSATGRNPTIAATGEDANIGLNINSKGTSLVNFTSNVTFYCNPAVITTNAAITYTAAHLLSGLVLRDPNGASRTDTFPSAASIVAAIPGCVVGTAFHFFVRNTHTVSYIVAFLAGAGITISGTTTVSQNSTRSFLCILTNVTPLSEAATIYSMGAATH